MTGAPSPAWDRLSAAEDSHDRQIVLRQQPIVIVDDDPSVSDSLMVLLETLGFQTQSYTSGMDFLADEQRDHLGWLIIDQHMPGIAGLDVLAVLQGKGISSLTILITGRIDNAIAERANKLGVAAILEKPFSINRLVELIGGGAMGQS